MKKSRFTQQQIAYSLRQAESGVPIEEITRKMGITQTTFYRWKKKFAGMGITDNAFIESFNGKFRAECLNENWFLSLTDARGKIDRWRDDYNRNRRHSSLGDLSPAEFAESCIPSASPTAQLQEYNRAI